MPPGSRHVPSAPAACPCSGVLVSLVARFVCFFFSHVLSLSPRRPRPFRGWALEKGAGGGGILAVIPFAQARRKHGAGTRHGTCPSAGGGGLLCGSRRHPTLSAVAPLAVPPWGLARRVPPLGTVVSSLCLPTPPRRPRGGVRRPLPSSPLSPRLLPVALASALGGCGRWGRGGGGAPSLPFLRRKHVAGTALARGTALALLLGCEARRVALVFALSTLRALPQCPPRWRGGAAARPSLPVTPTLGGAEACGGGGLVVFLPLPSRRRHEAWLSSLCRGGGGFASRLPPSPLLSYARTPGGPPAGACTARALCGHGRVARPTPSFLCLPTLPRCPRGGGGGRFSPLPYPHSPSGGWWCWGRVGRPFRLPSVARTSQACRRHSTTTGRGTWLPRGGGGFPLGLPALLHGIGPALQDHQPLLPPRR